MNINVINKTRQKRIAVGGSAANPPHLGHRVLIEFLLNYGNFDEVIWMPSGIRPDKNNLIDPNHRVAMTMLTFELSWLYGAKTVFSINFQDVYGANTPTIDWLRRIKKENHRAEIIWYTGVDSVIPQAKYGGNCEIATWEGGREIMEKWNICVLPRPGYEHPSKLALAKNVYFLEANLPDISSTDIVSKISSGEPFENLVTEAVATYIKKFKLYGFSS